MKAAKIVGYIAWFLGCFTLAVLFTFPLDGIKPLIITEAEKALGKGKQGLHGTDPEVTVESVRMSGLGVKATRVHVRFGNREPEPGPELDVDSVWVSASLLSAVSTNKTLQLQASLYGGDVDAEVTVDEKQNVVALDADVDGVDLGKVPFLIAQLGVPVEGKIDADVELEMGKQADKDAAGHIDLDVKGLGLGAGRLSKGGGFELPEGIKLGNLKGRVPIKQGVGTIELLKLEGAPDVEAEVAGTISIKPKPQLSRLDADGWFRPQAAFLDKNVAFKSAIDIGEKLSLPGAPSLSKAKDDEGRYHFSAKGALATIVPQLSKDAGKKAKARSGKATTVVEDPLPSDKNE
ncbi:MAG: type II secretion system protein GspN [Deltaproteobacteria bacterium]|nr:type II secretion system protein GspN [Deltaproteobacteria bacterium]